MKILGIDFAPLRGIPFSRRLQTLCIFYFSCEFFFLPFIYTVVIFSLLFTQYYYIALIYYTYFYFDFKTPVNGGNAKPWIKKLKLWQHMIDYFPLKAVKTVDLDPKRNYIFGVHPHGVTSTGTALNFCCTESDIYKIFPDIKIKMATLDGQFIFPIHRDLLLAFGFVSSSKEGITSVLKNKESLALVVGGAPEALSTRPDHIRLYLKNRKGFVKLALKNGVDLVPVFQFGENEIWHQTEFGEDSLFYRFQRLFTDYLSFSPPVFHGRGMFNYTFGVIPFRKPITTVVGKPIHVDKVEEPTSEEVETLHKKYVESLMDLFNEYNPVYGIKDSSIEIY